MVFSGKRPSAGTNPFQRLNLTTIPFEPQGEYLDTVSSVESGLRTKELKQCNEIIEMARTGGKLIAAVVRGEPGSGKTALAYKLKNSARLHPKTKHIYVKMESGSYDDPFFILSLIVDQLQIATSKINQTKVDRCLSSALDLAFDGLVIQNSDTGDLRRARHLMSQWYGYINALISAGEHDCVVIHLDEVEDRWATLSMTAPELERDLKYLRDLLGFIQEGSIDQTFPVALFLYMTEASFQHIGGVNNALATRLERTIYLSPFTENDALEFIKTRLEKNRIRNSNVDVYDPFTQDGILLLIKNSHDENNRFSWRKYIINCHDILYSYRLTGGPIDKHKVKDWISGRTGEHIHGGGTGEDTHGGGTGEGGHRPTPKPEKKFSDVDFTKQGRDRVNRLLEQGFIENQDFQLDLAMSNIPKILSASFGYFAVDKTGKLAFTITGENARIPLSIKKSNEARTKSDIFCLFVRNSNGDPASTTESEFVLTLPNTPEMMIRYALFDSSMISSGDIDEAKGEISNQIKEFIEKLTRFFNKHREVHYIPSLFGTKLKTDDDIEKIIDTLCSLSKCNTKNIEIGVMGDWGFFDGACFSIPQWYQQILIGSTFDTKQLWERQFYFNREQKPIEAAVALLKKLEITDGLRLRQFDERKIKLVRDIEDQCTEILKINKTIQEEIGEEHAGDAIRKNAVFHDQLIEIKNTVNAYRSSDNIFSDFIELHSASKHFKNVLDASDRFNSTIRETSNQYEIRNKTIAAALQKLSSLRFKNRKLETSLTEELIALKKVFTRPDKLEYLSSSRSQFDHLISKVNQFEFLSKQRTEDISKFKFPELKQAIDRKIIDHDEKKLETNWKFIQESDDLEKVESKLLELRQWYAELEEKASRHKEELYIKYSDGRSLLKNCERYLSNDHLEKIAQVIRSMEKEIEKSKDLYKAGELIKVFGVSVDSAFASLAPTLKSLFKPDMNYTLESIAKEFGIDESRTRDFVKFLDENKVLVATYRVGP